MSEQKTQHIAPDPDGWIEVDSSNVAAVSFNFFTGVLHIKFHDGSVYAYEGFTVDAWLAFARAESKGKFVAQHIRNKYPTHKITDGKAK